MNDIKNQKYKFGDVEKNNAFGGGGDEYKWNPNLPPELDYVIDTPPPTVSGTLHVGHVYSYTQADIIARYFRMSGKNVLYPIGWDDNGLPTERLVEKNKKVRGGNMERDEFVELCKSVIPEYEKQFYDLFSRLALSVDWSHQYQTISDDSRTMSQLSFIDLYDKGLLERRMEPALWDPADRTTIAQAEVDELKRDGLLNHIQFQMEDEGDGEIEIATTRPELIAACAALLIHPEHPKSKKYVGKMCTSPLFGVRLPIIEDESVDPEMGSGVVMCCTFGDVQDIAWWRNHKLPLRVIINNAGRIKESIPIGEDGWESNDVEAAKDALKQLEGLKVAEARKKILEMLKESGDLGMQESTNQIVPVAERSRTPLEIIVTPQWFIKTLDYKDELLEKGKEINWHPEYMYHRFENWVTGLKWDWAISRQRHFGVALPIWYSKKEGEEGKVIVAKPEELPVDPIKDTPSGYNKDEVEPEKDVMDTWATSSVSPQLVTRTINKKYGFDQELHERCFPMSMRPQAHEIIRTWAFYTIVKALHHEQKIPWKDICISGWCLATDGSKMSKSMGNVIDPIKLLDEHGTDAVRYWTGTSRLGNDTNLSENTLKQGNRLATKLWNAAKLALIAIEGLNIQTSTPKEDEKTGKISHPLDLWMLGRLTETIEHATKEFEIYHYANALNATEEFFWSVYCDNYLELVKHRIWDIGDNPTEEEVSAVVTLTHATKIILKLFAPFVPCVTSEISKQFGEKNIHARDTWPKVDELVEKDTNKQIGEYTLAVLSAVRKIKADNNLSMKAEIKNAFVYVENGEADNLRLIEPVIQDLKRTTSTNQININEKAPEDCPSAVASNGLVKVAVEFA